MKTLKLVLSRLTMQQQLGIATILFSCHAFRPLGCYYWRGSGCFYCVNAIHDTPLFPAIERLRVDPKIAPTAHTWPRWSTGHCWSRCVFAVNQVGSCCPCNHHGLMVTLRVERKIVCSRPVTAAENLPPQLWSLKFFDLKWIWDQVCFRILACHESRQKAFSARIVSCEACSQQLLRPKRKPWISVRICWDDTCTSILWTSRAQIWWVKREAFFAALWWTLHYICTKHTAHICSLSSYPRTGARSTIYHIRNENAMYTTMKYIS